MVENKSQNRHTFTKEEKLCSQKSIDRLFLKGSSFISYPLRVVCFVAIDGEGHNLPKVLISVPKRKFKRANKRNRLKRLIREAYRLNKHSLIDIIKEKNINLDIAFLFLKDELSSYAEVEKAVKRVLLTIGNKLREEKDEKADN